MAEVKNEEEPALHSKRKPDLSSVDKEDDSNKQQKIEISGKSSSIVEEKPNKNDKDYDEDDEEEYEDDDDDDEDDEGGEHSNGKAEVDRKGKGILREDKGKGKLIDEEDGSDDDSSDGDGESDGDSDLSDDPLAEVDLDNILPSRTRRRMVQPGVYLANDLGDDSDDVDSNA